MIQSKAFVDASHALDDVSHAIALLESENAKLRELVYEMLEDEENGHNDESTFVGHVIRACKLEVDGAETFI